MSTVLRAHYDKHKTFMRNDGTVFDATFDSYLRKSEAFVRRKKDRVGTSDGSKKWVRDTGEYLIEREGKIVSYGQNID